MRLALIVTLGISHVFALHAHAAQIIPAAVNPVNPMPVNPVSPMPVNPLTPLSTSPQKANTSNPENQEATPASPPPPHGHHHAHSPGHVVTIIPPPPVLVDNSAASVRWYEADPRNNPRPDMVPTNVWSSNLVRVTGGYSPANPAAGLILVEDFRYPNRPPEIIYTPTATGPVRITSVNFRFGVPDSLIVDSQAGNYPVQDTNGTHQNISTPGGARYEYDGKLRSFIILP